MRFGEVQYHDALPIDGYGPGMFRVAGAVHEGPLLIANGAVLDWGGAGDFTPLEALRSAVDVLFFGTGTEMRPIPPEMRAALAGMPLEPMQTGAACRTYNVLLGEGRRVGAALLPV